ncbi:MAG TPA: glycosyltransferase family 4 protein [Candidatus Bathyarchaeia archaeon]|nr:glycosyltransferase family 4 protein [Candidatus Bathyarchaeia archaeon]
MARICVIRQGVFPLDARLTREVDALVAAGHEVDLICQSWPGQPREERKGRLAIHRLPQERRRQAIGKLRYLVEYGSFLVAAAVSAASLGIRRRFDVVQVNSLPDCLVFAALVPKLLGARVLLDLMEAMPEFFQIKYRLPAGHPAVRLLMFLEQQSIRFADQVLTCTEPMRERFVERGARAEKIAVTLNSFDEQRVDPRRYVKPSTSGEDFVLICHGTIDHMYGLDLVVRAVARLRERIPGLRLRIYGGGPLRDSVESLAGDLGVREQVWFSDGWRPLEELLPAIAAADVGVIAIRRDVCFDLTHSNKMFDLIAMGKPVVISRTRAVKSYFGEDCFELFDSGDLDGLTRAIERLHADPERRARLARRASDVAEPYRWVHQRARYLAIVERLAGARAASPVRAVAAEEAGKT